jgi:hypothetical protein
MLFRISAFSFFFCLAGVGLQAQVSAPVAALPAALISAMPPLLTAVDPASPGDIAHPEGLPEIGKWMVGPDGGIASWLGWKYQGKQLREPINVIIFDPFAKSGTEAYARLEAAAAAQEFEMRVGHSTGYDAIIGGQSFEQLPGGRGQAISDGPFELPNNHGRIFGPLPWKGGWLFTAAFSRENIDLVTKVKHHFASFNRARDAFSWALDKGGRYRVRGFVPLSNAIVGYDAVCTGDHDGIATYLVATE